MAKIIVEIEVDGNEEAALEVVDGVLDAGVFQDAINGWERDEGSVRVTSAVCRQAEER